MSPAAISAVVSIVIFWLGAFFGRRFLRPPRPSILDLPLFNRDAACRKCGEPQGPRADTMWGTASWQITFTYSANESGTIRKMRRRCCACQGWWDELPLDRYIVMGAGHDSGGLSIAEKAEPRSLT